MSDLSGLVTESIPQISATWLFVLFFFGTFLSEDASCVAAGAAAANGQIGLAAAIAACFLGIFVGDMLLFGAGRAMGQHVFENRFVKRFISEESKMRASNWLENHGGTAVFLSRFASGLRLPTYLAAGALRTSLAKFALYFLIASALWVPLLVGSVALSQNFIFREDVLIGLVIAFLTVRACIKYASRENRRMLVGRLKRIRHWEFWPIYIFYIPVALYIVWLAVSFRSLTAFTAVNPSIPAGGFKGESKDDIYKLLEKSPECILPHALIVGDLPRTRIDSALKFMRENELSFPVVVKPNTGERGNGVRVVHSEEKLLSAMAGGNNDLIVQQHVEGEEVSVFYCRRPNEVRGQIFSITEKRFPEVCGDGASTIRDLILRDGRAVAIAAKYFEQNTDNLNRVLDKGEAFRLIDIGTHSRGAIFVDGSHHYTQALGDRIDEICRNIEGFYFGRFDIRIPTFEDLHYGKNIKIIELNGVTSESTNIYDPKYSFFDAYHILFRQWRIAFEIGIENIKLGARPTRVISLGKMAFS